MEDTYLPAFRAAIVDAHARSIMCAYNRIDGQPARGSDFLLKDRLRGAWGFKGYVVSDCDGVKDIADIINMRPMPQLLGPWPYAQASTANARTARSSTCPASAHGTATR
ncbi:glycoside hydrolase family 3 N-terminal domain-containing protein [Sphingobium lactosutens]|uniref:glycoside hydrolase family 3 N-terminal domain-containing protein n=1 Tax=Sphingobium lactosutens TaxID=522773 RepID=UPI002118D253|nr:glycoside hydrolase family 3 N-terminal domain-containing protein [Sphingobium lactosutens]